ncbi:hypothetical protein jhhlp_003435 [Lomentospora prolificans]|uniref:SET domain-containing protein n=1 Tax=Lomentospora prolificans TaxID=41688 RepID=A0A2N3N8Q6_9PEZI|nr:hypothetical protein jhhlp_003435 [Lomentospora prolificans]
MTEKLQPLSTQIGNPSQILIPTTNAAPIAHVKELPQKVEVVEEEPYTIKCICNFPDDDGNTIYCETCETWQHIDCFYPDNREEALRETFSHYCHQCKPRPLDQKRAIERTQKLRNVILQEETHDKKSKRPASKSHKKKPKPNELQLNGNHTGHDAAKHPSPSDHHPPTKKAKISHRPSNSISSQPSKKSPAYGQTKPPINGQQQPSPANTPPDLPIDFEIHNYTANFFSLHSEDDVQIVQNNSFASLNISNTMSLWLQDRDRLKKETGQEYKDAFQKLPADIDSRKQALRVEQKSYSPAPDKKLRLQYLTTPSAVDKDVPLMELNGMIGFQKDYCADPENFWPELTSPLPFVFFHPLLPLYVDTRKEGSEARYVRRSCKPNAVLDTYLSGSGGSEYHFWLVSDRHIAAKEQITLPWDFRFPNEDKARLLYLLGLGDDDMDGSEQPDMDDLEYLNISTWLHRLLSEYGGCACDLGSNCAFARFHRHYLGRTQARSNPSKKKRKVKTQNVSPTSTGYATNSRAASEGQLDDGLEHDAQSISSRSKPPSRDRTPFQQIGAFDQLGILTEPTDRDKRKVAMAEEKFRLMEQQQGPQRKKKRLSDGASSTKSKSARTPASMTPNLANGHYVDAGTSRSKSGSPASALSPRAQFPPFTMAKPDLARPFRRPSSAPRATYCDAGVQTDPVDGEWFSAPTPSPKPRRRVISLSQRLLNNRHRQKLDEAERKRTDMSMTEPGLMDVDSPDTEHQSASSSPVLMKDTTSTTATSPAPTPADIAMVDAPTTSPTALPIQSNPENSDAKLAGTTKIKTPDLKVEMPPVPSFTNAANGPLTSTSTPLSATSSIVQSPFSVSTLMSPFGSSAMNGVQPSPVKKKLSLSDYRKSRMDKDKAAAKPAVPVAKPISEDTKPAISELNGNSPTADKPVEEGT